MGRTEDPLSHLFAGPGVDRDTGAFIGLFVGFKNSGDDRLVIDMVEFPGIGTFRAKATVCARDRSGRPVRIVLQILTRRDFVIAQTDIKGSWSGTEFLPEAGRHTFNTDHFDPGDMTALANEIGQALDLPHDNV